MIKRSLEGTHPNLAIFNSFNDLEHRGYRIYDDVICATLEINQEQLRPKIYDFQKPIPFLKRLITQRGEGYILDLLNQTIKNRLYGKKIEVPELITT